MRRLNLKKLNPLLLSLALAFFSCYIYIPEEEKKDPDGKSSSSYSPEEINELDSLSYMGKMYKTIQIGSQIWFAENIDAEPSKGNSQCYGNIPTHCDGRGKLYDWEAASNVCPSGWKLPSKEDYNKLIEYVEEKNGNYPVGKILKSSKDWEPNASSDKYKFAAIPSGYRDSDGNFKSLETETYWWTSSESGAYASSRGLAKSDDNLRSGTDLKTMGFSVRCIKK